MATYYADLNPRFSARSRSLNDRHQYAVFERKAQGRKVIWTCKTKNGAEKFAAKMNDIEQSPAPTKSMKRFLTTPPEGN